MQVCRTRVVPIAILVTAYSSLAQGQCHVAAVSGAGGRFAFDGFLVTGSGFGLLLAFSRPVVSRARRKSHGNQLFRLAPALSGCR